MIENRDGSFEPPEAADILIKCMAEQGISEKVKAIHFGKLEELEELAGNKHTGIDKLKELQQQMNVLTKALNRVMIHLGLDDKSEILVVDTNLSP